MKLHRYPEYFARQAWRVIRPRRPKVSISHKSGLPPGSMVYIGPDREEAVQISATQFNQQELKEWQPGSLEELTDLSQPGVVTWIDLDGVHDLEKVGPLAEAFNLDPLTREDIVNTLQRPKLEVFDNYLYLVVKYISVSADEKILNVEQVSIILTENLVLTFQERREDVFAGIRERLRKNTRIRMRDSAYLVYAMLDDIVSHYFKVTEWMDLKLEDVEADLHESSSEAILNHMQDLRQIQIYVRKAVLPLRELMNSLERHPEFGFGEDIEKFLRDLQDQVALSIDTLESQRDQLSNLQDLFLSLSSHRQNKVIQVLTLVSSIFIPLSFLAGIYGMNFATLPGADIEYGFWALMGIMFLIGGSMFAWFRSQRWF